jgi:hypothetical protein
MIDRMFATRRNRKKQRRVSLVTAVAWLFLSTYNCTAIAASSAVDVGPSHHVAVADADNMDCCETLASSCCELPSPIVPSKFADGSDSPVLLSSLPWIQSSPHYYPSYSPGASKDWRLLAKPPRLHLLHCSFLA